MTRPLLALLVSSSFAGCAYDRIDPPANESMTSPALSHPREPRKSADPPPPIREDLQQTKSQVITQAEVAQVRTSSTLIETSPGVVSPLR